LVTDKKDEKKDEPQVKFKYVEEFKKMGGLEALLKIKKIQFDRECTEPDAERAKRKLIKLLDRYLK
jgi:hypothetical protein